MRPSGPIPAQFTPVPQTTPTPHGDSRTGTRNGEGVVAQHHVDGPALGFDRRRELLLVGRKVETGEAEDAELGRSDHRALASNPASRQRPTAPLLPGCPACRRHRPTGGCSARPGPSEEGAARGRPEPRRSWCSRRRPRAPPARRQQRRTRWDVTPDVTLPNVGIKVAVVGGGSTYTPELVDGLCDHEDRMVVDDLVLLDPDELRRDVVGGLSERILRARGWSGAFSTTADPDAALEGADFVVVQLRVGGQAARRVDETLPVGFGCLGQETVGAGGLAKALRTVPVVLDLAERTAARANPGAWFVDFTNPVGIVTQALLDDGHRAVGLCNVAIWAQRRIGHYLGVDPDSVMVEHVGLNHLTWVRSAVLRGSDDGHVGLRPSTGGGWARRRRRSARPLRPLRAGAGVGERGLRGRPQASRGIALLLRALLLRARRRGVPAEGSGLPAPSRRGGGARDETAPRNTGTRR